MSQAVRILAVFHPALAATIAATMFWRSSSSRELSSKADAFRRVHERWLSRVMRAGTPLPRIPVRPVDAGGFDDFLAQPRGREVADRWWRMAFARLPEEH